MKSATNSRHPSPVGLAVGDHRGRTKAWPGCRPRRRPADSVSAEHQGAGLAPDGVGDDEPALVTAGRRIVVSVLELLDVYTGVASNRDPMPLTQMRATILTSLWRNKPRIRSRKPMAWVRCRALPCVAPRCVAANVGALDLGQDSVQTPGSPPASSTKQMCNDAPQKSYGHRMVAIGSAARAGVGNQDFLQESVGREHPGVNRGGCLNAGNAGSRRRRQGVRLVTICSSRGR